MDILNIIKIPKSREKVIFQCDELYFENYSFFNLLSCNKLGYDVHIHFINVSDQFLKKVLDLKLDIDLSISTETVNTDGINYYKLKSYYFTSRYFVADYLFKNNLIDKAYIIDADIIFNERISFDDSVKLGVLHYPEENNLWRQSGANFMYVTSDRKDFIHNIVAEYNKRVSTIDFDAIEHIADKITRANMYGLDQVCISYLIKNEKNFLNIGTWNNFISKFNDAKIWSFTGAANKGNLENLKKQLIDRFNQSF